MSYETIRLREIELTLGEHQGVVAKKIAAESTADRDFAAKQSAYSYAAADYAADPSQGHEVALRRARDARDAAEVTLLHARSVLADARKAVRDDEQAIVEARAALEALARAERIAELRRAVTTDTAHAAMAPHAAKFVEAISAARAAIADLVAVADSIATAEAALRELGEVVSPLAPHHLVRGLVDHLVEIAPATARGILTILVPNGVGEALVHRLSLARFNAETALDVLQLFEGVAPSETTPEGQRGARGAIDAFFSGRTVAQGMAALRELRTAEENARRAAAPGPEPVQTEAPPGTRHRSTLGGMRDLMARFGMG